MAAADTAATAAAGADADADAALYSWWLCHPSAGHWRLQLVSLVLVHHLQAQQQQQQQQQLQQPLKHSTPGC
jgi:hypothetical protein